MMPATSTRFDVVADFCAAAEVSLRDLQTRIGLEGWWVLRRNDHEHVVLAAIDSIFGQPAGTVVSWADSFCRVTVEHDAPPVVANIDEVPAYAEARARNGMQARSLIVVPLTAPGGREIGILRALGTSVRPDLPMHFDTVKAAAAVLAVLLSHELDLSGASARDGLAEDAAHLDALTGIGNRRAWDEALVNEEARCARHADQAAVIVLDIDGLKVLNDTHGHGAGDDALVRTAAIAAEWARASAVVARLGGDEFGVLLPSTDVADAWTVARNIQRHLRSAGISVSIGVAGRSSKSGLLAAWQHADLAMSAEKTVHRLSPRVSRTSQSSPTTTTRFPSFDQGWTGGLVMPERHQLIAPPLPSISPSWGECTGTTSTPPRNAVSGTVVGLLDLLRRQLRAQTAFASVFDGGRQHLSHVVSETSLPDEIGSDSSLQMSVNWLIATGAVPLVCADVAADPQLRSLAAAVAPVVGSYAAVALVNAAGEPYGTFGVFSDHPDLALSPRDADVLRAVTEPLGALLSSEAGAQRAHHRILDRLDRLVCEDGLRMHFQPVVDLHNNRTVGAEALARFPETGLRPDEWFAMATSVGAGTSLELQAAAAALRALGDPRLPGFLSVNLSSEAACSPGFTRLLGDTSLDRLVLEITEHEEVKDYGQLQRALAPLRTQGLRLAVDDTGAGYASMRHVLSLEPDIIKLDISLIRDLHTDPRRRALAAALTSFAGAIGARVIAEGIETAHELACLTDIGVDYGQGYHLARPAPLESLGLVSPPTATLSQVPR